MLFVLIAGGGLDVVGVGSVGSASRWRLTDAGRFLVEMMGYGGRQ